MDAQGIVRAIGDGVVSALETCKLFLGVEQGAYENATIHPEYVTTVKVGEALSGMSHYVTLEAMMSDLRVHAFRLAVFKRGVSRLKGNVGSHDTLGAIDAKLAMYSFGDKRLDILVRGGSGDPPILMAEAKLGAHNVGGILRDVGRILRLMQMYQEFNLLDGHSAYGAVVFHAMTDGGLANSSAALPRAKKLLTDLGPALSAMKAANPWFRYKSGLLASKHQFEPIQGYREEYDDGTIGEVEFERNAYSFAPGLVLLGNAPDIETVCF